MTHMARNVECCLLFEVTNTVLVRLVKVQQLPKKNPAQRSPDRLTEQVPREELMIAPSNHSARLLETAGSSGAVTPT